MEELQTERLILRHLRGSDRDRLVQIFSKPEVMHFPMRRAHAPEETEAMLERFITHWEQHGFGHWGLVEIASGTLIGYAGLAIPAFLPEVLPAVEVGWRIDPDFWGRGYAPEAARAALRFGFETLKLHRIISIIEVDNAASIRVAEKLGMIEWRRTTHPAYGHPLVIYERQAVDS